MEVTIAMLVSAICITICYTAYSLMANYYSIYQKKNEQIATVMSLKKVMEKDFFNGKILLKTDSGFVVQRDSLEIMYVFRPNALLRQLPGLHTDTFKMATIGHRLSFENQLVLEPDTIDEVSFDIALDQKLNLPILIHKRYSATDLLH